MDIERTIQFILESQARAEVRMENADRRVENSNRRMENADRRIEKAERRMEKAELRADVMEKRMDKRMDAIGKLLQQGMRMLVKTDTRLAELAAAQKATDRSLKAFIDSLRSGRNGR